MKTIAAVCRAPRAPFDLEEVALPPLGPADVLVRIAGVGICRTDLILQDVKGKARLVQ